MDHVVSTPSEYSPLNDRLWALAQAVAATVREQQFPGVTPEEPFDFPECLQVLVEQCEAELRAAHFPTLTGSEACN